MNKPSVILLGSKPGAVAALAVLVERGWDVQYVVASPGDEPEWLEKPSLQEFAQAHNLNVLTAQSAIPDNTKVDFVISYMYRNLVVPRTLNMANEAPLNFHAGPLPQFGGWAFYNIAILEGSKEYGCTCHYMDQGFDTGPLLRVDRFTINPAVETAFSLERKAQAKMVKLFIDFCEMVATGEKLPLMPQNPVEMRYMKKDEFESLKEIPLNASSEKIERYARAFWYPPYGCAFMMINGKKIEIIPEIVKEEVAKSMHSSDLTDLLSVAGVTLINQRTGK
ncbi:hypothetical protein A9Q74_14095 [Colwellia sp. 39_35_sub15_T18]|mgnify:CR=1 FL=1|nr:hypothetical protein A9Q74_14095 [Colwellia sp. 39_35_sub15_T18]